jgi:AraC-like DNA-binding protein
MVEMGGIQKRLRTTLEIAMERTSDPHALLAAAEHESLQWPRQPKFEDTTVTLAGQEIVRRGGVVSVSTLARDAGISLRHFERRFHRIVGLSPKRLSNVLRFQQVFQTVEAGNQTNWTEVALHCGYFDQAHLNRDFRRFAASTPPQIFSCRDSLTHQFTRKNRVSNFSKTK